MTPTILRDLVLAIMLGVEDAKGPYNLSCDETQADSIVATIRAAEVDGLVYTLRGMVGLVIREACR